MMKRLPVQGSFSVILLVCATIVVALGAWGSLGAPPADDRAARASCVTERFFLRQSAALRRVCAGTRLADANHDRRLRKPGAYRRRILDLLLCGFHIRAYLDHDHRLCDATLRLYPRLLHRRRNLYSGHVPVVVR
jgi:hypothetical protein